MLAKLSWLANVHPVIGISFKDLFERLQAASRRFWDLLKAEQDKINTENAKDLPEVSSQQ